MHIEEKCKICNKTFKNEKSLIIHLKMKHNINYITYAQQYMNFEIPKCPICGKDRKHMTILKFRKTCGNKKCLKQIFKNQNISKKTKEKISKSMKKAHKEGRAWNIGQSRWNNEPSYPEEFFMRVIENELNDKKYKREYPISIYSIDFAWPHKKLAIEIDGSQHKRFKEYKKRDQKKDDLLKNEGWKILRINWSDMCNDTKKYIKIANDFINNKTFNIDDMLKIYNEYNIVTDYKYLKNQL
ncbi:MAG: DUF559 domain-containing protein, partial [archaeon]